MQLPSFHLPYHFLSTQSWIALTPHCERSLEIQLLPLTNVFGAFTTPLLARFQQKLAEMANRLYAEHAWDQNLHVTRTTSRL
jgi:hypothetical protein